MKVWVERDRMRFYIHAHEPQWEGSEWLSHTWEWGHPMPGWDICGDSLKDFGFELSMADAEVGEYDLSGKKPRLVCIWQPVIEEEGDNGD